MADQIVVSESALGYLQATRPWVKFLAIVGFVFMGLMVLVGLMMTLAFSAVPQQPGMPPAFGPIFGTLYIVMAGIYLMPCLFMHRYAKAIAAIPSAGQGALEEALKQQKSFWKFMGILMLVMLCLYAAILVFGVLAAVLIGVSHH
jgi:hypothetical protein